MERKTSTRNEKICKKWKQNKKGMHGTDRASVALLAEPLVLFLDFWRIWERLIESRSLLSMRCLLPEYNFEPRPHSRALCTAGSVTTIGLSIHGSGSHLKNQFDGIDLSTTTSKACTIRTEPLFLTCVSSRRLRLCLQATLSCPARQEDTKMFTDKYKETSVSWAALHVAWTFLNWQSYSTF